MFVGTVANRSITRQELSLKGRTVLGASIPNDAKPTSVCPLLGFTDCRMSTDQPSGLRPTHVGSRTSTILVLCTDQDTYVQIAAYILDIGGVVSPEG